MTGWSRLDYTWSVGGLIWSVSLVSHSPWRRIGFHKGDDWTWDIFHDGSSFTVRISENRQQPTIVSSLICYQESAKCLSDLQKGCTIYRKTYSMCDIGVRKMVFHAPFIRTLLVNILAIQMEPAALDNKLKTCRSLTGFSVNESLSERREKKRIERKQIFDGARRCVLSLRLLLLNSTVETFSDHVCPESDSSLWQLIIKKNCEAYLYTHCIRLVWHDCQTQPGTVYVYLSQFILSLRY